MGEPLANYRNVFSAIGRMNDELGIGQRRITVSTVGIVPNIRKLTTEQIQVKLAISLHCATDEERTALLPANKRYGGLDELMLSIKEYTEETKRRVTFEWALIEFQNDSPEVARQLGNLLKRFNLRKDLCHVNVIPLNPTGGFKNKSPSGKKRVDTFVGILKDEFGLSATPRVRRGIDIDAGCGQLKSKIKKKEEEEEEDQKEMNDDIIVGLTDGKNELMEFAQVKQAPVVGVYEDEDEEVDHEESNDSSFFEEIEADSFRTFDLDDEEAEFIDNVYETKEELEEADRLLTLVQASFPTPPTVAPEKTTTTIVNDENIQAGKKRRKKLLKLLKQIKKLKEMESNGTEMNEEQLIKISREEEFQIELESVEHNLK